MKKLFFLFFLPLWVAGGLSGGVALAQSTVTITPMGANYGEKTVTFLVKWSGAAHNDRVWIWVDYCPVEGVTPASTFSPAAIGAVTITASDGSKTTSSGSTRGFFVAQNPATVTATLLDASGKFNWCAYGSGAPPKAAVRAEGGYTLQGAPPFKINGTITEQFNAFSAGTCIESITDLTGNSDGIVPNAPTVATTSPAAICYDATANLSCTVSGGTTTAMTYTWKIGAAASVTYAPSITTSNLTATTTYTVTVSNANGCTSTVSNTGTITVAPDFTQGDPEAQTICYDTKATFSLAAASGGVGAITYLWQQSSDNSTWTAASGTSTNATYTTPALTSGSYYRRVATSAGCNVITSNSALVTVRPAFTAGAIATTGQTVCVGGTPSQIGNTSAASGGNAAFTYTWYKDGSATAISGATATTYTPPAADANATGAHTYTRKVRDGACNTTPEQSTGSWVLTVVADPSVTVKDAQTICYNTKPAAMTATPSNGTGSVTYQWYSGASSGAATTSLGSSATASTYAPGSLTATTYYRVIATYSGSGCNAATATAIAKTVRAQFKPGTISSTGQTVCVGGTPSQIGNTSAASGGNTAFTYTWYKDGSATAISGATATTYTPPAADANATGAHTYTRKVRDGACNTTPEQSTGSWVLTVVADPSVTVKDAQTICYNTKPAAMTATPSNGTGSVTYQWYSGASSGAATTSLGSSATASTYAPGSLTTTTYYRVIATYSGSGCNAATATAIAKTVRAQFKPGAIATTGQTICNGAAVNAITSSTAASGGDATITYQWRANGTVVGATTAAYTPSAYNTTAGAYTFTRWAHDGTCNTAWTQSTGSWVLTVRAAFNAGSINTASVSTTESTAPATNPTNNTAASGGNETITYEWRRTGTSSKTLGSSNSSGYTINSDDSNYNTVGTYNFKRYAKDGACNTTLTASSGQYTLTVASSTPPSAGTNTYTCGTQTWSEPIKIAACDKTSFTNDYTNPYCRSYTYNSIKYFYYNWAYVNANKGTMCPTPWHVPTKAEFSTLLSCLGTTGANGTYYPESSTWGGALAGFARGSSMYSDGSYGYYWTADEIDTDNAYYLYFRPNRASTNYIQKYEGYQIRCVR